MPGMNKTTGATLDGLAHLRQSIRDILQTPIGTRVMRRDYGSRLFELVDAPLNGATLVEIYAATADALRRWEPRFRLSRVQAQRAGDAGWIEISLEGTYLPEGLDISMDGIIL